MGLHASSRWLGAYATGFFLVLVAGFAAGLLNPALLDSPAAPVVDGSWSEAYQRAFDAASPLLEPARTTWGLIDTRLFGQGRTGVLIGADGWLYSREEYATVSNSAAAITAWVDRIVAVRESLAAHGTQLVVALVPAKAAMVPHHAPAALPSAAAGRYEALLRDLRDVGIVVSDLRPALDATAGLEPSFLRTDTHWTPAGAAAAAEVIAATVRAEAPFVGLGTRRFATEEGPLQPHWGDLTVFLDLGPLLARFGPPPDLVPIRHTVDLDPVGTDLFGEVEIPVTLIGTSYSADPTWNALGALREALGSDVLDGAEVGLGPWEPMRRYLESEALRSAPPAVVVWEFPERYATLEGHVPESEAW